VGADRGLEHGTRDLTGAGDGQRRAHLAAERTYLSWWRTSLATLAVALAIGKVLPDLLESGTAWPYLVVGIAWGLLAATLAVYGFLRQRALHASIDTGGFVQPHPLVLNILSAAGVMLIVVSALLVLIRP
jgi:uncharacterized membrane protein YidH (DUF202 family)